jgi:2-dehydropantoate 2-reductase
MRILVVGAGSTGGYFGGRLAQAGRDVTFLVRPARAARLRAAGLEIVSPHGNVTLQPKLVTADRLAGPFELVLLTVKAFALEAALADLAPGVGPGTMILPVLNGMKHMDAIAARFGKPSLLGGVAKIATMLDEAGRIRQLAKFHDLSYGEMDGLLSERIKRVDAALQGAGFDARLVRDIELELWEKWLLLAAMGGVTCLMRGNIGEIEAVPGGREFALRFVDEVVAVVTAAGRAPREAFLGVTRSMLTAKGSPQAPSMYRDLQQGLPVEADQIIGDLLARGQKAGVPTPLIAAAYAHLAVYQARLG